MEREQKQASLTERQEKILDIAVREYINSAEPVSSKLLEKKYRLGVSPATIRNEMQKLADKGYLSQPHTSSGRVPTDKGYRFFVDNLWERGLEELEMDSWLEKDFQDTFHILQSLTRKMAEESHALILNYLEDENLFWKEGWEEILKEPEFKEEDFIDDFTDLLKNLQARVQELAPGQEIRVYIGKENPLSDAKEFTIICKKYSLPENKECIITILGPKRMEYEKNLSLINSLSRLWENF